MRSLRFRLTVSVLGVLSAVLVIFAVAVQAILQQALVRQLDGHIAANAAAVAGMAEDDATAPEFEYEALPEFERAVRPGYFQAWLDDGRVLGRSPSLGTRDLARLSADATRPSFADVVLPDGRPGRAFQLRQPLRVEDAAASGLGPSPRSVTVVVAQGIEEIRQSAASVSRWLWILAVAAFCAAAGATLVIVSRSLRPARSLAAEIGRLDAGGLDRPLPTADLPGELEPIVAKLNELLSRLAASFARERRFTADVSHELRTPLAALRTTLEVAASRERSAPAYRDAILEATALTTQMQILVQNLLTLARLDARQVDVQLGELRLRPFVDDCWRAFEEQASQRRLTFSNQIDAETRVQTDAEKLRIVVVNLLSNAADYTAEGGAVAVRAGNRAANGAGGVLLEVRDSGPRIPDELLPRIFDRFSRGDVSRSGGLHCGVGLALVRGVCDVLDLGVSAENGADGTVCFRIAARGPRDAGRSPTVPP
jgi:signal transduction histidine kinase